MPPKDSIQLGPGMMYFNTPEGLKPLGGVQKVEITEEAPELDILGNAPRIVRPVKSEFTATITLTRETSEALRKLAAMAEAAMRAIYSAVRIVKEMVDTCPNRRVVHLALHGSPRVRKKNAKRIAQYYAHKNK